MSDGNIRPVLAGQKALIVGVANDQSIAYGCAKAFRTVGAEVAITWLNERARPYVEPLARELGAPIVGALDVSIPGQLEALFDRIRTDWGKLDILVHSIAFAPKADLQGGLLDCSAGRIRKGDGHFMPLVHPDGKARCAAHDRWRDYVRNELLWRQSRRSELQRDGSGEGCLGGRLPISRLRTWPPGNTRTCHFSRAAEDACSIGAKGLRASAE